VAVLVQVWVGSWWWPSWHKATLVVLLSPQLNTLPIHDQLARGKRSQFPIPCLSTSTIILVLGLPLALVPYYLLPVSLTELPSTFSNPAGVFEQLPADDGWVNLARVLMCAVALGSCNMWILRGRDSVLKALGVERGERHRIGRFVGLGLWALALTLACIGGIVAEKVEMIGVLATLSVTWVLPCESPGGDAY
jgi:hypothetical protein